MITEEIGEVRKFCIKQALWVLTLYQPGQEDYCSPTTKQVIEYSQALEAYITK